MALEIAERLSLNPDKPRNLAKTVTVWYFSYKYISIILKNIKLKMDKQLAYILLIIKIIRIYYKNNKK